MPDEISKKVQAALQKEVVRDPYISVFCSRVMPSVLTSYTHWHNLYSDSVIKISKLHVASQLTLHADTTYGWSLQEQLQLVMSAQFTKQETALKKRVAELEQKAAAAGVA